MKKYTIALLTLLLLLLVTACAGDGRLDTSKIDFSTSTYKHLTNGGYRRQSRTPL